MNLCPAARMSWLEGYQVPLNLCWFFKKSQLNLLRCNWISQFRRKIYHIQASKGYGFYSKNAFSALHYGTFSEILVTVWENALHVMFDEMPELWSDQQAHKLQETRGNQVKIFRYFEVNTFFQLEVCLTCLFSKGDNMTTWRLRQFDTMKTKRTIWNQEGGAGRTIWNVFII